MKIKTITCHDVYNLGASLQAYALSEFLKSIGNDVEIINYKPEYLERYFLFGHISAKYDRPVLRTIYQIVKFPKRAYERLFSKRKKAFDKFTKEYLKCTEFKYKSNDELKDNIPKADLYIAGSDQIWNPVFQNGKDPAFFLDFVPDDKVKISYAASFAVNSLSDEDEDRIIPWLKRLSSISVRESSGVNIIKEIGLNAVQVMDPVFLLDAASWKAIAVKPDISDYILVYDFDKNEKVKGIVLELSKRTDKKIVSVFNCDWADKIIESAGPLEFLGYILNADLVISNSFHATAFSIIFNKDFYVVNRTENINTRMADLLSDLDLSDRLINTNLNEVKRIDYSNVNSKLKEKVADSKLFLKNSLSV